MTQIVSFSAGATRHDFRQGKVFPDTTQFTSGRILNTVQSLFARENTYKKHSVKNPTTDIYNSKLFFKSF